MSSRFYLFSFLSLSLFSHHVQEQDRYSWLYEERVVEEITEVYKDDISCFYVDIGAGDGECMSNTARLALNGWQGLAIEGDKGRFNVLDHKYEGLNVQRVNAFIRPDNVKELLKNSLVPQNFGILSLDIDGYDYYVLDSLLEEYRPSVIITEINEKFPPPIKFSVLYDENYTWGEDHFFGMSIAKLYELCKKYDYEIYHLEFNNAFLVKKEIFKGVHRSVPMIYDEHYKNQKMRRIYFPWNKDVNRWLELTPEECAEEMHRYFEKYEGKYTLEIATDEELE